MSPATAKADWSSTDCSMVRSGQIWVHTAKPTTPILSRPLTRFIRPSTPNMRLRPAKMLSLEKSGLIFSSVMLGRACSTCPASAAMIITAKMGARMVPSVVVTWRISAMMSDEVETPIWSGCSRNMRIAPVSDLAVDAPNIMIAIAPPSSSTKAETSGLLTMSPWARASSSRFCVGCSVCCDSSRSSAMG